MHPSKIKNLLALSERERYDYFIRNCADFRLVWGLVVDEDNWVIFRGNDGQEIFPVWPHEDLASECMFDEHRELGARPHAIELEAFIEECIPEMGNQNVLFGIFYNKRRNAIAASPRTLEKALRDEIKAIWE